MTNYEDTDARSLDLYNASRVVAHKGAALPANEAAHLFVRLTGASYIAAEAYLPKAYETCTKCDRGESHSHPVKAMLTELEIGRAVAAYGEDVFCEEYDC